MYTNIPRTIIINALGLLLLGLITGNTILLYVGIIPILYTIAALYLRNPQSVEVVAESEMEEVYVDEKVRLRRRIIVDEGIGPVLIHEFIPYEFKLLNGNNIHMLWKGLGTLDKSVEMEIQCSKRGIYSLGKVTTREYHPFNLIANTEEIKELGQSITVKPKPSRVKRVRQRRQYSLFPFPSESRIKFGVPTTDFREIREYNFGDPYKKINWKATARLNTQTRSKPSVNEYEREGRRVTWILLDTSPRLELGNNIRNTMEYAIQAVTSITEFYIQRQCMVGYAEFTSRSKSLFKESLIKNLNKFKEETRNYTSQVVIFPDAGSIQLHKIERTLLKTQINSYGPDLKETIHSCRGHIIGTNPLFIVLTTIDEDSLPNLRDSLKELLRYTLRFRDNRSNVLLINVSGYSLASASESQILASKALRFNEKELLRNLATPRVTVLNWDPEKENIVQTMLSTVRAR